MLWRILLTVIYFTQRFIYLRASKTYISLYFLNYTESNHGVSLKLFKSARPNSNNRELKLPRRRRQQNPHKFAYLTMENSIFARFARAFFIF